LLTAQVKNSFGMAPDLPTTQMQTIFLFRITENHGNYLWFH